MFDDSVMIWDEIPEREWSDLENEETEIDRTKALLTQDASYFIDSVTQKTANDSDEKLICNDAENNKSDNVSEIDHTKYENLSGKETQYVNREAKHDLDVSRELEVLSLEYANVIDVEQASAIPRCINLDIEHDTLLSPPDDFLATQLRNEKSKKRLTSANLMIAPNEMNSSITHCNNNPAADYSDISVQWMNKTSLATGRIGPEQSQTVKNSLSSNEANPNKNKIINSNNISTDSSLNVTETKSLSFGQAPENDNSSPNCNKHGGGSNKYDEQKDDTHFKNVYSDVSIHKSTPPIRLDDKINMNISEIVLKARLSNIHTTKIYISDEDLDESINAYENISALDVGAKKLRNNGIATRTSYVNVASSMAESIKTMKTVGVQTVLSSVNIQHRNIMDSRKRDLDALHLEVPKDQISFGQYCTCSRHKVNICDLRKKIKKEKRCSDSVAQNSTMQTEKPRVRIGLSRKGKFKPLHRRNFK